MQDVKPAKESWPAFCHRCLFSPASLLSSAALSLFAILFLPPAYCFTAALFAMMCAAIIDLQTYRLPDCLTLPVLILSAYGAPPDADARVLGAVGASMLVWLTGATFQRIRGYPGLGFGDVKLTAGCGAIVGVGAIGPLLLVSALLALLSILAAGLVKGKAARGSILKTHPIAFGPFLSLATLLIAFAQQEGLLG